MKAVKDHKQVTVRGIVMPAAWDDKGNVVDIMICAFDEEEYIVERSIKGEELFRLLRKEVEVTGELKRWKSRRSLEVKAYTMSGKHCMRT